MFDFLQSAVQPIIADAIVVLILGAVGWSLRLLPQRWRLDIEARHRAALHSAVDTAVGLILDTVQRQPGIAVPDAVITRGIGYVTESVPDAIKRLGPSQATLEALLRSRLQQALDAATGRDRLTEALREAGGPVPL